MSYIKILLTTTECFNRYVKEFSDGKFFQQISCFSEHKAVCLWSNAKAKGEEFHCIIAKCPSRGIWLSLSIKTGFSLALLTAHYVLVTIHHT